MPSALALPPVLMSRAGSSSLLSGAANQRWSLLQADCQTCCKDAATFMSSYECFVALGNSLSFLFAKHDPADSFAAASGPSSVFSGVPCRGSRASSSGFCFFRLISLPVYLLFLIQWYFYSFPGLHFLLCILFLLPKFQPSGCSAKPFPEEWVSSPQATVALNKHFSDFPP